MAEWYVKELSKLTNVSVQTLHYYDRVGLLKPSIRLSNGYRVYSESDLLKLQQIIALKFFGFKLSHIKKMMGMDQDAIDHFSSQAQFLEEKAKTYLEASRLLKKIISDSQHHKSIPWKMMIKLIEVYSMTRELAKSWAGQALDESELKEYAQFEHDLQENYSDQEKKMIHEAWDTLVNKVESNLDHDPSSEMGIALGKQCMDWVNNVYGKEYVDLRNAIWEKGFKGGHGSEEHGLSPKGVAWLDKAIDAYYRGRIYSVLNQSGNDLQKKKQWAAVLDDMYGDNQALKDELVDAALKDGNVSQEGKNWLKKMKN